VHSICYAPLAYNNRSDFLEFVPFGTDDIVSMADRHMFDSVRHFNGAKAWSFLFAGIGDARHLLATMGVIGAAEEVSSSTCQYHFAINDIKPEVFARDLVIFLLLDRLSDPSLMSMKSARLQQTLYYVYISQVTPPEAYGDLQEIISHAIQITESKSAVPEWLCWKPKDVPLMLQIFQAWSNTVSRIYSCAYFTKEVRKSFSDKRLCYQTHALRIPEERVPHGCEAEYRVWKDTCLLLTPDVAEDRGLQDPLHGTRSTRRSGQLQQFVDDTWKPNVTLVGLQSIGTNSEERIFDKPSSPHQLFDYVKPFFEAVLRFIKATKGRFAVEFLQGDITNVLEQLHHGSVVARDASFPSRFDRIHLNNIP
jgi:hypothetical protein